MGLQLADGTLIREAQGLVFRGQDGHEFRLLEEELPRVRSFLEDAQSESEGVGSEQRSNPPAFAELVHELNNLLTPIVANADFLLASPESTESRKFLESIRLASRDAVVLLQRAKTKQAKYSVELTGLLGAVYELMLPMAESKGIQLTHRLAESLCVWGDETALRQVFVNLVRNAMEALPDGGTVSLRLMNDARGTVVEIEDNGVGMSQQVRERCFHLSFSTKGSSGLGLAISRRILHQYNGSIEIDSTEGVGTIVHVLFDGINRSE